MATDEAFDPSEEAPVGAADKQSVEEEQGPGGEVRTGRGEEPASPPSVPAGSGSNSLGVAVPAAFDLGWTMADLAAVAISDVRIGDLRRILPSEHELDRLNRSRLQAVRISCLSADLRVVVYADKEPMPTDKIKALQTGLDAHEINWRGVESNLKQLHLSFLGMLACSGRPLILAYQLGRSLHDTTYLPEQQRVRELADSVFDPTQSRIPQTVSMLAGQLGRARVLALQGWLEALAPHFPADTSAVVKTSVGRWSDWAAAAFDDQQPGSLKNQSKDALANDGTQALLRQGDVWLNLLAGTENLDVLLSPEARVAAGEAALARSSRIVRRVALHYWLAIVLLASVAAGLTVWAGVYLIGAGKVWTQIATIGSALGITAKGIGTRIAKLADAGERPIYRAEEIDALAWAITAIPQTTLSNNGVRTLRRSGIQRRTPLGRA